MDTWLEDVVPCQRSTRPLLFQGKRVLSPAAPDAAISRQMLHTAVLFMFNCQRVEGDHYVPYLRIINNILSEQRYFIATMLEYSSDSEDVRGALNPHLISRCEICDVEKIVRAKWRPRCEAIDNVREELARENKKLREENDRLKERVSKQQDELIAQHELAKARHEEDRARHEERMKDLKMVYQRMQELHAQVTRSSGSQGITAVGSEPTPPVTVDKPSE